MKLPTTDQVWSVAGVLLFVVGGFLLATGRFGPGTLLMAGAAFCLGSGMAAHRRRLRRGRDDSSR